MSLLRWPSDQHPSIVFARFQRCQAEIQSPDALALQVSVIGEIRQRASTADLIFDVEELIAYASRYYTLHGGDLIFTSTPEGVGPVVPGNLMQCPSRTSETRTFSSIPPYVTFVREALSHRSSGRSCVTRSDCCVSACRPETVSGAR
jgi:Fumarylacetoacetate (FAA) hydrolase family